MFLYLINEADRAKLHHVVAGTLVGKPIEVTFRYGFASAPTYIGGALVEAGHATNSFRNWGTGLVARGAAQSASKHRDKATAAAIAV